ncbi:MAG: acyltransferase family protein [Pseudomonadota bacterium]
MNRFNALDQVRGLAIAAMILAHFGPAIWERIGLDGVVRDAVGMIGRFATPTFIAIFGITVAFAYLSKAARNPAATRAKLVSRSGLVLVAAILVASPEMVETVLADERWGESLPLALILDGYGVLSFYVFAILVTALIIPYLSRNPYQAPLLLGSILIFFGTYLGYDSWSNSGQNGSELVRLYLVSGKYALLVNYGIVLLLVSFGTFIRREITGGRDVNGILMITGTSLALLGLSLGRIVGWRTLSDLQLNYDAPPQVWYLFMVCGAMMIFLATLNRFSFPGLSFILEQIGRNPLAIYVAHAFVLPAHEVLEAAGLPENLSMIVPFVAFLCYCAFIILWKSRDLGKAGNADPTLKAH